MSTGLPGSSDWWWNTLWTTRNKIHWRTICHSHQSSPHFFPSVQTGSVQTILVAVPYLLLHHLLIHTPPPHTLAFSAHHIAMSGYTTNRPTFSPKSPTLTSSQSHNSWISYLNRTQSCCYCNNPGVLVAPVWLSHVCLTGLEVLWERLVGVWWLGIDWRHFHVADRIG